MFNKNDPLIGAVQEVMKKNQAERDAIRLVNEKFGVADRKALPHEKQSAWDAAYKQVLSEGAEGSIPTTPREKKLAAMHGNPNRITHGDKLKAIGAIEEAEAAPKTDPYQEQQAGSVSTVKKPTPKPKSVTPADQSALKSKIQSIMKEGAKVDRMVAHIKNSEMKAGKSAEKAENIAWATANKRGMLQKEALDPADRGQIKHQTQLGGRAATGGSVTSGSGSVVPRPAASGGSVTSGSGSVVPRPAASGGSVTSGPGSIGDAARRQAQRQQASNAIRNMNSPSLRTTNKVDASSQTKGPNVGLPQARTTASTGEKANVAGQKTGPNAATSQSKPATSSGVVPKPKLRPAGAAPSARRPAAPASGTASRTVTPVRRPNALQQQQARSKAGRDAAVTGPGGRRG